MKYDAKLIEVERNVVGVLESGAIWVGDNIWIWEDYYIEENGDLVRYEVIAEGKVPTLTGYNTDQLREKLPIWFGITWSEASDQ